MIGTLGLSESGEAKSVLSLPLMFLNTLEKTTMNWDSQGSCLVPLRLPSLGKVSMKCWTNTTSRQVRRC